MDVELMREPSKIREKLSSCWALTCKAYRFLLRHFCLLSRVYYDNWGQSKWIISWVAVAGLPITALALIPTYFVCGTSTMLNFQLLLANVVLGFLRAADNLMYAYAYAYLPASTASLLASLSLVFLALFGYIFVKNKVNVWTVNSVVIISAAMTIIALDSDSDRYGNANVTNTLDEIALFSHRGGKKPQSTPR